MIGWNIVPHKTFLSPVCQKFSLKSCFWLCLPDFFASPRGIFVRITGWNISLEEPFLSALRDRTLSHFWPQICRTRMGPLPAYAGVLVEFALEEAKGCERVTKLARPSDEELEQAYIRAHSFLSDTKARLTNEHGWTSDESIGDSVSCIRSLSLISIVINSTTNGLRLITLLVCRI